jgi:hypothetical protein
MSVPRKTLVIGSILLLLSALGGCLFEPRTPEAPGGEPINYLPQSGPDNVVENLELALKNTDASGYERQIALDFVYEPDSGTTASYPDVIWEEWNREQEVAFVNDFLNNVSDIKVDLRAEINYTNDSGNSAEHSYIYTMEISSAGSSVAYRASAILEFKLEGTQWVLSRWYDEQGENDPDTGSLLPTFGQRRGAFAAAGGR